MGADALLPNDRSVLLPFWVVLGHNALYTAVGFVWLFFADDGAVGEEEMVRQNNGPCAYQLAAMLCFLVFADNLLGRIEGTRETTWLWLRSGWLVLIVASGVSQRGVPASVLVGSSTSG
jgi:hypothetical protein